jgi:nucleoside-diphosphate-sugar epimerase
MGLNLLISGSTGFVGSNLSLYLKKLKSYNIIPFDRKIQKIKITNIDTVIHLAGKAHDLKNVTQSNDYFESNYLLTKKIFDAFINSSANVFIFISSVKAAADSIEGVLTEDITPKPKTIYGQSKLAAEEYILSVKNKMDKRVYILRPCMIHGPNNKGNLNLLYKFISKGIPYPFGIYNNRRSFLSIDNLCFVINELINNDKIASGIYNIADDDSISTIDLVKLISEVLGKPNRILKLPKSFISFLAKIGDFLPIPVNSERLQKLTENYEVSNLKIKNVINKKLPLSSIEGIKKTIASF